MRFACSGQALNRRLSLHERLEFQNLVVVAVGMDRFVELV